MINKRQMEDVKRIMSVEEGMIKILPAMMDRLEILNPWVRQLPRILHGLKLKRNQTVLDIPCGKGGVSVPLAKRYHVKVIGYDIIDGYVKSAKELAERENVSHLCDFRVGDIRSVVKKDDVCDILLWIAPPHIWKDSKGTIKALRSCVKPNGKILIADAYVYKPTKKYTDYETLESTNAGYTYFGDKILRFIDYRNKLWEEDYKITRKSIEYSLKKVGSLKDKKTIQRHLNSLDKDEDSDKKYLGLGIWILKVKK